MNDEVTPLSLNSREGIALVFALGIVLLIAFVSYRNWTANGRRARQLEITSQTISGVDGLLLAITRAETGQRGFLLTGDDRYLRPYRQALADIPALLKFLAESARSHRDQAERVRSLDGLVNGKLKELETTIEIRRHRGLNAALAVVRTEQGRTEMEQIQSISSKIWVATNSRLSEYSEEEQASVHLNSRIAIIGGAALFFLLIVATLGIQKGMARRQSLIGNLRQGELRPVHFPGVAVEVSAIWPK